MTDNIEEHYTESEYNDIFNDWYEIEGARKIKELSRQLRTFFNYKASVIRYRFRSSPNHAKNNTNTTFFTKQQEIELLSHKFIILLKKVKKQEHPLEEGIRALYYENDKTQIKQLLEITEKLSMLLHYFSEESIHNHPRFLKFVVSVAINICLVKKCMNVLFREFYEELKMNYLGLEGELESLLEETKDVKNKKPKKQLEEMLTL